jgi:hypothetical protein
MVSRPDPFEQFAARNQLQIAIAEVSAAPRDVLAQPSDLERYLVATLTRASDMASAVRMLFVTDATVRYQPTVRDVLWWLSSDSWAIEQGGREYSRWAATYGYQDDDAAALHLFQLHHTQAIALGTLLGGEYTTLLALYESEVASGS